MAADATDDRRTGLYAAIVAASTAVFVALAVALVLWERVERGDARFVDWVHRTAPDWLVDAMRVLTYLGSGPVLAGVAVVAAVLLIRRGQLGAALFVAAALVGSQLVDQALKYTFRRARPVFDDPFVELATYAFPSGHAFSSTATYGALALVIGSMAAGRRSRVAALATAALLIVLISASRVVLGVHYLLDVVAGVTAGVAVLGALLLGLQHVRRPSLRVVPFPGRIGRHEQPKRTGVDA